MRTKSSLVLAGVVVVGSLSLASASAAAKSLKGESCPVKGATLTVSNVNYTCVSVKVTETVTVKVKEKVRVKVNGKWKVETKLVAKKEKKTVTKLEWNGGVASTTTTTVASTLPTQNFDTTPAGPMVWSEYFTGAAGTGVDSNIWTPVTGYGTYGTGEIENNTTDPSNLSQDGNGDLVITAKCVATTAPGCEATSQAMGQTWTSARIWTENKATFEYGQLEARIWMPAGSFNWPAFWMMGKEYNSNQPDTGWPYCGELDIAEGLQDESQDQSTIHANIPGSSTDWGEGSGLTQVAPITGSVMTSGWHTYGILWKPNSITYILDGKAWAVDTYNPKTTDVTQTVGKTTITVGPGTAIGSEGGDWPFNAPFFIIMNDAVGGVSSPVAPNGSEGQMKINWVKYYKYDGYGTTTASTK